MRLVVQIVYEQMNSAFKYEKRVIAKVKISLISSLEGIIKRALSLGQKTPRIQISPLVPTKC